MCGFVGRELGPVRMSGTYAWGIFGVGNWGLGEFEVRSFASRLVIFWVVIMNFISFSWRKVGHSEEEALWFP